MRSGFLSWLVICEVMEGAEDMGPPWTPLPAECLLLNPEFPLSGCCWLRLPAEFLLNWTEASLEGRPELVDLHFALEVIHIAGSFFGRFSAIISNSELAKP